MKIKQLALTLAAIAGLCGVPQRATAEDVTVVNDITNNVTWVATNTYFLDGYIYVLSNAVLNIQAGTVIKGLSAPTSGESASALFITRDAQINAAGTATNPIIFTAEADDVTDPSDMGIYERGLWGGVVIMGNAPINTAVDTTGNGATPKYELFEGLPDTQINGQFVNRFGGTNVADNSGTFRYVSIRHCGFAFLPNKELNGLSLGAVGNGTTIDHVEAYAVADDGFEFFGGTVNTKYLVSAFNDDDAFDCDMGYSGQNQFWFSIQENGKRDSGGEWNGEPSGLAVSNSPVANWEIYNATFLGAGPGTQNTNANHGLTIREYAAPKLYNSVMTDFNTPTNTTSVAVRITDGRAGAMLTNGLLDLRDNLFWGFNAYSNSTAALLFTDGGRHNEVGDPMLASISRTNNNLLDPRPLLCSPALITSRTAPANGFYEQAAYKGAFDATNLWIAGWTFLHAKGFLATNITSLPAISANEITVVEDITNSVTWYRTNTYLIDGYVYVLSNAVLNIEAGTVIKGLSAPTSGESASALFVTRHGKIFARGNQYCPIIFTAEADDVTEPGDMGIYERGLWGGVVIMGNAPINTAVDTTGNGATPKYELFEGLPDTQINGQFVNRFGGTNNNDNSGVFRGVSIRHCGFAFLPNKELNGLSLGAVGNGTTIEFVETYAVADDGFEFFGGTVNTKYLVSAFNDDDAFDCDLGYSGKNQFWFSIQENGKRDSGGEWNGEPSGLAVSNSPVANWEIYNATFLGAGPGTQNTNVNNGLVIREYAAPRLYNSVMTDFNTPTNATSIAVRINDVRSGAMLTNGLLDLRDNLFWGFNAYSNSASALLFTDLSRSNEVANPLLTSISRTNNNLLDPRPAAGSPALTSLRTPPTNGLYTPVAYKGAFDATNLWLRGWTFLDAKGFLPNGGIVVPPPNAPTLTITDIGGGNVQITHPSQAGYSYQLRSTISLAPAVWGNEGGAQAGTGGTLTNTVVAGGSKFFQVLAQ